MPDDENNQQQQADQSQQQQADDTGLSAISGGDDQPQNNQQDDQQQQDQQQPDDQQQQAATAGLSEEQMVRILKAAGVGQPPQQQQQQDPPRQMTQEEFDQRFNVFKPTNEMIEAIRAGGENALAAMAQMAQGINRQATTLMGYQLQLELQKLKQELGGQIAPVSQFMQEQQRQALKKEFLDTHPELADYEILGEKIVAEFQAQGKKFSTKEEAFKAVAEGIKQTLTKIGVTPKPRSQNGAAANGSGQQTKSTSRMSTLSGGGQGAGNQTKPPKNDKVSDGFEVFS